LATRKYRLFRAIDVSGAAFAILFLLPLSAVCSLLLVCEGAGPPIVRNRRVRLDGSHYDLLSFRTHCAGAGTEHGGMIPDVGAAEATRPSRLGHFLRTTGFDEIPALINVAKGDLPICGRFTWRQVIAWLVTGAPRIA
jgi:undecaprenyl phosphate N,N'-diacetylbacillosamine 1-phosphate transferase